MADQPQAKDSRADDAPVGRLVADVVAAGPHQVVNGLESLIRFVSPRWVVRRAQFRRMLSYYEAARPTTYRRQRREPGSGDTAVLRAGASLREHARHLEQNHDLARGALNILVANVVGPHSIGIEPHPSRQMRFAALSTSYRLYGTGRRARRSPGRMTGRRPNAWPAAPGCATARPSRRPWRARCAP